MNVPEVPEDCNEELITDFIEESREAFDEIESILIKLDQEKIDDNLVNTLIQRLHSVTSIMELGGFGEAAEFGQSILAILTDVRNGVLSFNERLNDIVMMSVDRLRRVTEDIFSGHAGGDEHLDLVKQALEKLRTKDGDESLNEKIEEASNTIFCETQEEENIIFKPRVIKEPEIDLSSVIATTQSTDLSYFRDLMYRTEECNPDWVGRGDRILNLCMTMNKEAGYPVDEKQLEAAVLMHDFGMSFIPYSTVNKKGELDQQERKKMQEHPLLGAELLYRVNHWDTAAKIVMQHHEREDGQGYPERISGSSVCDGARILAIADTLVAMTIKQPYRDYKRPLSRAIVEINASRGTQFSEYWVDIFNQVIRHYKKIIVDNTEHQMRIAS